MVGGFRVSFGLNSLLASFLCCYRVDLIQVAANGKELLVNPLVVALAC